MVVGVVFLLKLCTHIYYHDGIFTLKILKTKSTMRKIEGLVKVPVVYLNRIRIS